MHSVCRLLYRHGSAGPSRCILGAFRESSAKRSVPPRTTAYSHFGKKHFSTSLSLSNAPPPSLRDHLASLGAVEHIDALYSLGVTAVSDIDYLSWNDLHERGGIPLAIARKIVGEKRGRDNAQLSAALKTPPPPFISSNTFRSPADTMMYLNEIGLTRGDRPSGTIFMSSVLAGSFLSWGCTGYVFLAGNTAPFFSAVPGFESVACSLIFPMGLAAIILSGVDLLTSTMMYTSLPIVSGDQRRESNEKWASLARLWGISLAGNIVGCGTMALATSYLLPSSALSFAAALAVKKTSFTLTLTTVKAIGANWLVNLAVYQAATAITSPGKIVLLWLPISLFVSCGLEHSVANMYLLPLGILGGADVSVMSAITTNLIPVLFGNAIGAVVCVSFFQWHAIVTPAKIALKKWGGARNLP